jgi:hypothetical protein
MYHPKRQQKSKIYFFDQSQTLTSQETITMEESAQAGAAVIAHETEKEFVHSQTNDGVTTASLASDKESADKNTHEFRSASCPRRR